MRWQPRLTNSGLPVDGLKRLKEALEFDPNDSETLTNIAFIELKRITGDPAR